MKKIEDTRATIGVFVSLDGEVIEARCKNTGRGLYSAFKTKSVKNLGSYEWHIPNIGSSENKPDLIAQRIVAANMVLEVLEGIEKKNEIAI